MATRTTTTTETAYDLEKVALNGAKEALNQSSEFWSGIEWFINFLRTNVNEFFTKGLQSLPIVGVFASRIGVTVTEFLFTVLETLMGFLKVTFNSPKIWQQAHDMSMVAWNANAASGHLAQIYAYGKKMAGYFLEIIKQSFERAIHARGLAMNADEKQEIANLLDSLLEK